MRIRGMLSGSPSPRVGLATVTLLSLALALSACGDDESKPKGFDIDDKEKNNKTPDMAPDMTAEVDMAEPVVTPPVVPAALRTTLMPAGTVAAGSNVQVICEALDEAGEVIPAASLDAETTFQVQLTPDDAMKLVQGLEFEAQRAGDVAVACASASLRLVDETPELLKITPGPAHTTIARTATRTLEAGKSVEVACDAFDLYGNAIPDAMPMLASSPQGDSVKVEALSATITQVGVYQLSCQIDGATNTKAVEVEVQPSLPANLLLSLAPMQPVYGLGQVVTVQAIVTDAYDNLVPDAAVLWSSSPDGQPFGQGRYRYETEGQKRVDVSVQGATQNNVPLDGFVEFTVNGTGPSIDCIEPADGEMVTAAPGSMRTLRGRLAEVNGISQVVVNGNLVTLDANNEFNVEVPVRYGINFIDVSAKDGFNEENSRTCAFLVSDKWAPEAQFVNDAVSLRLAQSAMDDYNPNDGLDSLNDILVAVLNSAGLRNTLDSALRAANPLKDSCDQRVFGACVFSSKVVYNNIALNGPNTSKLDLVTNGLRLDVRINNIGINATVDASLLPNTTGWADFSYVRVDLTSDFKLVNGKPRISLRQVNTVEVGSVNLRFSGFTGVIIDILEFLFENQIRNLLKSTIEDYIKTEFNKVLDGLVSNLDVASLGSSFAVPRLDGNGTLNVGFDVNFTSLGVSAARALFGVGTKFTAPILRGGVTKGAAMPSGQVLLDVQTSKAVGASIHAAVLNQVLHTLWRGGFFDATIGGATLGGSLPMGTKATLSTALPPVLVLVSNKKVQLHLGAISLSLVYPGLFDEPLDVVLGATAFTGVEVVNDTLSFSNIIINELYFSTPNVSLDATTRDLLEDFLKGLLQNIINQSLNNALPSLPIPSFEISPTLSPFGLPLGANLGLVQPALSNTTTHFILDGNFGVQ